MRDDTWLFSKLDYIWDRYFADIPQENDVIIKFGRKARCRLGSIKQENKTVFDLADNKRKTVITINGLFRHPLIPEYVIDATIAHELCHYAHGFSSPLEKKYASPHQGGVVTEEMKSRGLADILLKQKKWLKDFWPQYVKVHTKPVKRRRRVGIVIKWI